MSGHGTVFTSARSPAGSWVVGWSLAIGASLGVLAQVLAKTQGPFVMLGGGVAIWITVGFLLARWAAEGRDTFDGLVWAATTMATYLGAWLLAYSAVWGLLRPEVGLGGAWLNERPYFMICPLVSAAFGLAAALSVRGGSMADACLALPIAWSLPEAGYAFAQGWEYVAVVTLPALALSAIPLAVSRHREINRLAFTLALAAAGAIACILYENVWF